MARESDRNTDMDLFDLIGHYDGKPSVFIAREVDANEALSILRNEVLEGDMPEPNGWEIVPHQKGR